MAIITKITTQQKNKERYNIFLDDGKGERYAFSIHENILISHNIQKGKEIDEFDLEEIQFLDDVNRGFQQAVGFLSYRMRSTHEVMQYLKEKDYEEAIIQEVIHKLTDLRYLNDEEFAIAYVRTNSNVSFKGPVIIRQELNQKGIPNHIGELALAKYSEVEQIENASKIAEKNLSKTSKHSEKMREQKLKEILIRKGYTQNVIQQALANIVPEQSEGEQWGSICQMGDKADRRYKSYQGWEYTQRMKQYLFQKGFPVELIEKYLSSEDAPARAREMDV